MYVRLGTCGLKTKIPGGHETSQISTQSETHKILIAIPIVHGYLYMVYLVTALQVGVKGRWHLMKILWVMLAGTLPVASFIAERRIVKQYP